MSYITCHDYYITIMAQLVQSQYGICSVVNLNIRGSEQSQIWHRLDYNHSVLTMCFPPGIHEISNTAFEWVAISATVEYTHETFSTVYCMFNTATFDKRL